MESKRKASILIVDDNANLGKTMSLVLERKGFTVTIAKDGLEAIERVKESPFEIIFMDIKMPLMGGVETYKRIKKIRVDAVVLMMTAYAVEDLIQEALQEGAYGVIYKPLDIEKVLTIIKEATNGKAGALILVVDDNQGICTSLRNILSKMNYEVGIALNGDEAIAMARERAFECIFIDMKLPTINGLETFLAIKEINPEVVAIMMTAYRQEMDDLVDEALRNNAHTCLYKPLDMKEVLGLVEEIVERKNNRKS